MNFVPFSDDLVRTFNFRHLPLGFFTRVQIFKSIILCGQLKQTKESDNS